MIVSNWQTHSYTEASQKRGDVGDQDECELMKLIIALGNVAAFFLI
jgi:hypothetical protein